MKRHYLFAAAIVGIMFVSGCSETDPTAAENVTPGTPYSPIAVTIPVTSPTTPEISDSITSGVTSEPDLSRYSEKAVLYTPDEIYLEWSDVGYISGMPHNLIITDHKQLDYAMKRYPLSELEPFMTMTETYPVEEYTYLLEYISTSGGGYHIIPGGLVIDTDTLTFIDSPDSVYPEHGETVPDVCSDYCYIAAVPKEYLINPQYPGWTYPDENDIYQDENYRLSFNSFDTSDLYNIYGDTKYLIRTREEYDSFLAMSSDIINYHGSQMLYDMKPDFEKVAFAAYFFTAPENSYPDRYSENLDLILDNSTLDIICNMREGQGTGTCTYMVYALIPKRYMSGQSYDGWVAPEKPEQKETSFPVIDSSGYGADALILTADDILIYGSHMSSTEYSGKYVICGIDGKTDMWNVHSNIFDDVTFDKFTELHLLNLDFENYPDSLNNIVFVEYIITDKRGLSPYALVIDGDKAEFMYTETENSGENTAKESYCFYAVVPEELLDSVYFKDWETFGGPADFSGITENSSDIYYKEPKPEDIVTDPETGIRYVRNQLLVSAFLDADKDTVESIFDAIGADIVGYIGATNDYQIEFRTDRSIEGLQNMADYINSFAYISNVMLNIVYDTSTE